MEPTARKFIIFSQARCGSGTLTRLLNLHPQIRCINEPFNVERPEGRYFDHIPDVAALEHALGELWKTYNGIKHVWVSDGHPFGANPRLNEFLLTRLHQRIIFLNRRNALRRVVSLWIARQTREWGPIAGPKKEALLNFPFAKIDVEFIRWNMNHETRAIPRYRRFLQRNHCEFMEIWHEDFFAENLTPAQKVGALNRVVSFLGLPEMTEQTILDQALGLFDPIQTGSHSEEIYARIPGLAEVEREFGALGRE